MVTKQFVLLASQRTGSNVLNRNINQFPGVLCHNEVFNPAFVGLQKRYLDLFGGEKQAKLTRDANPLHFRDVLLQASDAEFVGFHLFPGHLQVVIDDVLANADIKKICLRRSVFQSYVSLRIAQQTNVWLVAHEGAATHEKAPVMIKFDARDFEVYEQELRKFWRHIFAVLEKTGQECFSIWYQQVNDIEVLNRCAQFLGVPAQIKKLRKTLKKQNPASLAHKVSNYAVLEAYARSRGMEKQLF